MIETEAQFQQRVIELAEWNRWAIYHVANVEGKLRSQTSVGFPDLVLCKPPRIVYAELKTNKGRLTKEQREWLSRLKKCSTEVHTWRPSDWHEIVKVIQGRMR